MCKNNFWITCLQWEIARHPLQWDELPQALSWQLQGHTILSVTYTEKIGKKKNPFSSLVHPKGKRCFLLLGRSGLCYTSKVAENRLFWSSAPSLLWPGCCLAQHGIVSQQWHMLENIHNSSHASAVRHFVLAHLVFNSICHLETSWAVKFRIPVWTSLIHCFEDM